MEENVKEQYEKKKTYDIRTLIFLHGFGVRGFFWDPIRKSSLENKFHQIFAPDLDFSNPEIAINSTISTVKMYVDKYKDIGPIYLVGHSLGGPLALLCLKELGKDSIRKIIAIAPPYGDNKINEKSISIQRWFLRHDWLLPGFLTRPRFFTKKTPKKIQKKLWKKAVKENNEFINSMISKRWFFTDSLSNFRSSDVLIMGSKQDRVVPLEQSEQLSISIGSKFKVYEDIGHDDYIYAPNVSTRIVNEIIDFFISDN